MDQHAIQFRRRVAVIVLVLFIIIVALAVKGCESSAQKTALRDYANHVDALIQDSQNTRDALFRALDGAEAKGQSAVAGDVATAHQQALHQLSEAEGQSVPSSMGSAQAKVVLALQMRSDGIRIIGQEIQPALGTSTAKSAITAISAAMLRFLGSDVVYKGYAGPDIAAALHSGGIPVGGLDGETINAGQFLPALGWLDPSFVAAKLGSKVSIAGSGGSGGVDTTGHGSHGSALDAVSVGAVTLSTTATNTVPASPAPTFTLAVTNSGTNNEYRVGCKVSISGLSSDSGSSTIAQTTPQQTSDCTIKLPSAPTPGTYQVTATVDSVPGETNVANNTMTFAIHFS